MSTSTSTTSKGKHRAPRKKKISPHDPVKAVRITDIASGVVIFERLYKWPDSALASNIGSLIQSFFQFAREIDDGGKCTL